MDPPMYVLVNVFIQQSCFRLKFILTLIITKYYNIHSKCPTPFSKPPRRISAKSAALLGIICMATLSDSSCNCCWFVIVAGWPCVLLQFSCVYCCHLMCICCTVCVLLLLLQMPDCWLEVRVRKVLRPATSTQVFLVSLCLKANAEMVPKIPSSHYMLLMQPSRLKFSSN